MVGPLQERGPAGDDDYCRVDGTRTSAPGGGGGDDDDEEVRGRVVGHDVGRRYAETRVERRCEMELLGAYVRSVIAVVLLLLLPVLLQRDWLAERRTDGPGHWDIAQERRRNMRGWNPAACCRRGSPTSRTISPERTRSHRNGQIRDKYHRRLSFKPQKNIVVGYGE
ncbi:hypothetical protein GWI33_012016 [Rhynchophorus ferrugineus]|uniref:Uncharacterized protein n=1 Tax=Rhynchophorus ferrugineus TaxID=354439 RepID=A0A834MB70_RHYFE|nr:hypothetical protein GWI33_012016 [Rhynchophorus ferrugineus]